MEATNSMTDQEAKWLASKNDKGRRDTRRAELRGKIKELEVQRMRARALGPEAKEMADKWLAELDFHSKEFVYSMTGDGTGNGRIPRIDFTSPGAMAFVLSDLWRDAIPELAKKIAGTNGVCTSENRVHMGMIDDQLIILRSELASLGG